MWFTQEQKTDFNIVFFFFFSWGGGVGSKKHTVEGDFRFWSRKKLNENQKMKEGGGGREGKEIAAWLSTRTSSVVGLALFLDAFIRAL